MTKPIITEHNLETNEIIAREMTQDEIDKIAQDQAKQVQIDAEIVAAQLAKENALAKLAALGLTADDLAALGL